MKFGIFSDLHLEFERRDRHMLNLPQWDFVPEPGVFYLNAGDTDSATGNRKNFINKHQDHCFSVLGNHDYYGKLNDELVSDQEFHMRVVDGVKIAGATLWTDLSNPLHWLDYCNMLIDQRLFYGGPWSQDKMMQKHDLQRKYLLESRADVIVSHHAPSWKSLHPKYQYSAANESFLNNLDEWILDMAHPPKLWVHGHVHDPHDYMIGETRVVCWPRGYPGENGNYENYQPKIVDISIDPI